MMGGGATTFDTYDYIEDSLVIDIVSTKTQKLVWQESAMHKLIINQKIPSNFSAMQL
ncbi:DUF4136 domain-containing protein [Flavobacterium chryseum]|uniref:DUF4136 domain-containing protein n=1 Tax=Flavobacterium sp. P3160 TaxID=2512113 RepID=UPI001FB73EE2|nr:DUF4136 domain-containing protein [Flavobacterium sp. P3160]